MAITSKDPSAKLAQDVKNQVSSTDTTQITNAADNAKQSLKNATTTVTGSIAGQIEGGVKSVTQKFDKYSDKLNNITTEGLIADGIESLEGMATDFVNSSIAGLTSKLGSSVSVTFSEPDSNGLVFPIASSLKVQGGLNPTVASILQLITGLGINTGNLQKAVVDGSPQGILDAGGDLLSGKMGAFNGAAAISSLAETAVEEVVTELENAATGALASLVDTGDNLVNSVNKSISNIPTAWDSDGNVTATTSISGSADNNDTSFNAAIANIRAGITDLKATVTSAGDIKQNLEAGKNDLENLSGGIDGVTVIDATTKGAEYRAFYNSKGDEYRSLIRTKVAKGSERGIIQGLSTDTQQTIKSKIETFAPSLTQDDVNRVINLSQGDGEDYSLAIKLMKSATGKDYNIINSLLKSIDTSIYEATRTSPSEVVFPDPYVIGSYGKAWERGTNDPVFPYISSLEELQAEMKNITREVTEVVVHWTETHTNKNIGSEEINKYHLSAGLEGIGYHYVIRRDGSLQRGRPVNLQGQHSPINNHDVRTIGIVFVGGINVPSETQNSENFLSAQSLTRSQFNTFDHFCRAMYTVLPGAQIVGHNTIDDDEFDPGFDVVEYCEARFGKKSLFADPLNQSPYKVSILNELTPGETAAQQADSIELIELLGY
jgi:hypothetical protein